MEAYTGFAQVYDLFMDDVPYEEWCAYLSGLLREHGIRDGLVLDLGCGTGKLTRLLAGAGYDMIGADASGDMLEIAMEHRAADADACAQAAARTDSGAPEQEQEESALLRRAGILYLEQDMREFELYGTVRAVVSICDSVNYLTGDGDLVQMLKLVNNYLDPGGLFIFDLNTVYKYRELLGEQTIAENRGEGSFIWDNYFDEETGINEYDLTLFIREEDGRYRKFEETHYQRAYPLSEVRAAVAEAGMELVAVYDAFTHEPPREDSDRVYVIAREHGKCKLQTGR